MTSSYQHGLLQKCKEAYDLVQGFLNDSLPWGKFPERRQGYEYSEEIRSGVKTKIKRTIEQLGKSIESHGYV